MEKDKDLFVVIMAGGVGSRFWPASRKYKPKQFMDILDLGKSLLQLTVERYRSLCPDENIYIVTNDRYKDLVKEQVDFLSDDQILLEPVGRNTAPCIAYASYKIASRNPDAVTIVAPSDHNIQNVEEFSRVILLAVEAARKNKMVTLGIKPHRPETGYGYIQYLHNDNDEVKKVKTFTEKPELNLAKKFLESGDFVWNSGMFIWRVKDILKGFEDYMPDLSEYFLEIQEKYYTDDEQEAVNKVYYQCRGISIDYGIMEKAESVYVIPADFGWSDLGSWAALHDIADKDENGNVISGNVVAFNVKDSIIKTSGDKLIVADGLKGYLITENDNAILICPKEDESTFRKVYNEIKKNKEDFL